MNDNELRLAYKRQWMHQKRHTPTLDESREHHNLLRAYMRAWIAGRCCYCSIILAEAPQHSCMSNYYDEDRLQALIEFIFSTDGLGDDTQTPTI